MRSSIHQFKQFIEEDMRTRKGDPKAALSMKRGRRVQSVPNR